VTEIFLPEILIPAVAQGALALEARASDTALEALLSPLDDMETRLAVVAERAFAARLGGGCHLPVAAHARVSELTLLISGMLGALSGRLVQATTSEALLPSRDSASTAVRLGTALAEDLLASGGEELLLER
jgi:hydroxymethylbilane synthase